MTKKQFFNKIKDLWPNADYVAIDKNGIIKLFSAKEPELKGNRWHGAEVGTICNRDMFDVKFPKNYQKCIYNLRNETEELIVPTVENIDKYNVYLYKNEPVLIAETSNINNIEVVDQDNRLYSVHIKDLRWRQGLSFTVKNKE